MLPTVLLIERCFHTALLQVALFRCAILSRYMYVMAYTVLLIQRCFHTALLQVVPYSGVPCCPGTCMLWPTQYSSYRGASIQLYCRWPYSGVPYCPGTCMLWPTQYYSYRGASIQLYCRWCPIQVCHTVQVCYRLPHYKTKSASVHLHCRCATSGSHDIHCVCYGQQQ